MSDAVIFEKSGHVVTLTLNRPDTRNALDNKVIDAIEAHCAEINRDYEVRAVIVTGAGKGFSSGGNVKDMRDQKGLFGGSPANMRHNYRTGIQRIPRVICNLEVPIIAAINGAAIGAGLDLACMCDIRIAAQNAVFAESFCKVGIIPGDGGAWLLPRVIGMARASEMIFTGDAIDATTALEYRLVSKVVSQESLIEAAQELAQRIAVNPPHVLRMAKTLLREGQKTDLGTLLEMSAAFQAVVQHTDDHREAVAAMFEHRTPVFSGKI